MSTEDGVEDAEILEGCLITITDHLGNDEAIYVELPPSKAKDFATVLAEFKSFTVYVYQRIQP